MTWIKSTAGCALLLFFTLSATTSIAQDDTIGYVPASAADLIRVAELPSPPPCKNVTEINLTGKLNEGISAELKGRCTSAVSAIFEGCESCPQGSFASQNFILFSKTPDCSISENKIPLLQHPGLSVPFATYHTYFPKEKNCGEQPAISDEAKYGINLKLVDARLEDIATLVHADTGQTIQPLSCEQKECSSCPATCAPGFCAPGSPCPADCSTCLDSPACKMVRSEFNEVGETGSNGCSSSCGESSCETAACCEAACCEATCSEQTTGNMTEFLDQLATAIDSQMTSLPAKDRRAMIRSGLEAVARNAQSSSSAQLSEIQMDYERQMNEMRRTLIRASVKASQDDNSMDQTFRMIFYKQDRNAELIQSLMENTNKLHQAVELMQTQMATQKTPPAMPQRVVNSTYQPSERVAVKPRGPSPAELNQMRMIRQQINELENRLEKMKPAQVRPATHLQPIYPEPQTLSPIYPTTKFDRMRERSR